ncbi:MAG: substrate-binding domain-containing protein [Lentisphaeria bacterium]|nr:substrate-binding domain-containing protein [Lentisphaeria bacterium]
MKWITKLTLLSLTAALITGCGKKTEEPTSSSVEPAKTKRIAVIPKGTTHPFWKSVEAGAVKAGEDNGFEIIWKGALVETDRAQQIQIIKQFVTQKVDGIVLAPLDAKAPGIIRAVQDATAAGIPVVIMDSSLNAEAGKDYISFAATSNKEAGRKGGDMLAELLGGKGKVVILRYLEGSASTENREAGCIEALEKYPDIEIIADPFAAGSGTIADAKNRAVSMIDKLKEADGVFASNDPATVGMLGALQSKGLIGDVKFVGFDASPPSVAALKKNEIQALVAQDPFNMGFQSVTALGKYFNGESVPLRIDTGAGVLTPDNLTTDESKKLLKQAE